MEKGKSLFFPFTRQVVSISFIPVRGISNAFHVKVDERLNVTKDPATS